MIDIAAVLMLGAICAVIAEWWGYRTRGAWVAKLNKRTKSAKPTSRGQS